MSARRSVAHFVITGEFLTSTARNLMLSDRPAKAWRVLAQGLIADGSMSSDLLAREVLSGDKRIGGDSDEGIVVETEDTEVSESYRKTLQYIYAGRVRLQQPDGWYRPIAEVTAFSQEDMPRLREDFGMKDLKDACELRARRVQYYAHPGERAVAIPTRRLSGAPYEWRVILFEPCMELPFWWTETATPEAALEAFLAVGKRLDERSASPPTKRFSRAKGGLRRPQPRPLTEAEEQARDEEAEAKAQARFAAWREEIVKQAGEDVFPLPLSDGRVLTVPRAPFEQWALHRTNLAHLAAPWNPVSPSGIKLPLDDRNHTDWMIGAGVDPRTDAYRGAVHDAAIEEMGQLQMRLGDYEATVLTNGAPGAIVCGTVGEDILVVPDLRPDRLEAVLSSKAVLTEAGGELAHLVQVTRELPSPIPILRVPGAMERFTKGMRLTVSPAIGRIKIHTRTR